MLNFDAFELVEELPSGKYAYDMVWVDEWRGERVKSRLCVCVSSRPRGSEMICLRERQTRFSSSSCLPRLRVARISDYLLFTSVLHLCTLEQMRNEESIEALARVLMRQARDKCAFPTKPHQSVSLQAVVRQFGLGTPR